MLLGTFAVLSLAIAAVGVYGVVSYAAARRTREFGIRIALGATAGGILRQVLGGAAFLIGAGLVLGVAGALALTRLLQSQLFGVTPADPATFAVIAAVLSGGALLASYLPARRAARTEPVGMLRAE